MRAHHALTSVGMSGNEKQEIKRYLDMADAGHGVKRYEFGPGSLKLEHGEAIEVQVTLLVDQETKEPVKVEVSSGKSRTGYMPVDE